MPKTLRLTPQIFRTTYGPTSVIGDYLPVFSVKRVVEFLPPLFKIS